MQVNISVIASLKDIPLPDGSNNNEHDNKMPLGENNFTQENENNGSNASQHITTFQVQNNNMDNSNKCFCIFSLRSKDDNK